MRLSCHVICLLSAVTLGLGPTGPALATSRNQAPAPPGGERLSRAGAQAALPPGAPQLPAELTARSWLVADADTGEVLAAQNAHLPLPPASTLKMLFADTVLPRFDRSLVHQVTPADLDGLGEGSSLVGVKEGLGYQVQDLWRGVFLSSGNDAVHVLARMNGGIAATVAQMQARADALQARDTHVVTPDGYDEDGQVSSAYDLTLFARAGLRNADFRSYCATKTADFPGDVDLTTGRRVSYAIANTDRLLGSYPGLIGVKNGYTTNAGATFTGAAVRNGRTLLVTVMHPESSAEVYDEAAELLDWGFAAAGKAQPVGTLAPDTASAPTAVAVAAAAGQAAPQRSSVAGGRPSAWTMAGAWAAAVLAAVAAVTARVLLPGRWCDARGPALGGPPLPAAAGTAGGVPERATAGASPLRSLRTVGPAHRQLGRAVRRTLRTTLGRTRPRR
ncbi:D-alanyl-D-alanine carboxypeptidase family protein [Kitasatospora paranensis]|uniref:D-alanyl-D-alanine carboxypeptidase family protein n=1 Tax=Kitasatospora paranensis TaxID=258053 RepID=A0ABW2G666_9ACTN